LNYKVARRTNLCEAQKMIGSLCAVLSDELQLVNIISANKVAIFCSVDVLYYPKYIFWIRIMNGTWKILRILQLFYFYLTALLKLFR
jgi:hypothetical protein